MRLDVLDPNLRTVAFDDVLNDGESESCAPVVTSSGVVEADESFEHTATVLDCNAWPIVADCHGDPVAATLTSEVDGNLGGGMLFGIVDKVA